MFQARIKRDGTGMELGSDFNRRKFYDFLKKNPGLRMQIEPVLPESRKQRGFFEGAMVPLVTFYQEGLDHRDLEDNRRVRDWLKDEHNGEMVVVAGKARVVSASTKGRKALNTFMERVLDWMGEQGYQIELLNPTEYKKWREEIFPFENGPDNYIDYLVETGRLRLPNAKEGESYAQNTLARGRGHGTMESNATKGKRRSGKEQLADTALYSEVSQESGRSEEPFAKRTGSALRVGRSERGREIPVVKKRPSQGLSVIRVPAKAGAGACLNLNN